MTRIYRSKENGKRMVVRKRAVRKRKMQVRKSSIKLTRRFNRKTVPLIVRARREKRIRQSAQKQGDYSYLLDKLYEIDFDKYSLPSKEKPSYDETEQETLFFEPKKPEVVQEEKSKLKELIENDIEGVFQLDFPLATYDYSIGGSLDYFIEKVRNDLTYLYQKYAEPDVEESDVTKPVTDPEFNTKFTTLAWKQLALRPKFRIRRRTMRTLDDTFVTFLNNLLTKNREGNYSFDSDKIIYYEFIRDLYSGDDEENVFKFILACWVDKIENLSSINDDGSSSIEPSINDDGSSSIEPSISGRNDKDFENFKIHIDFDNNINKLIGWDYSSNPNKFERKQIRSILNNKLSSAWNAIVNGYNYDEEVPSILSVGPSGMKALKLRAPNPEYKNLYDYLCFRLEPHHDFHGDRVTLKTKSKGAITTSNKDAYKVLKRVAEEYDKISKFNIDDFTYNYVKNNYDDLKLEFSSYDEFTNLLKIMKKIKASQNSVTLSFKEAVDNKITKDSLSKVWAKGLSGQELTLNNLIEEVAKLIQHTGIYRDAGGSVFLGRIADLKNQFATNTVIKPLIEKIESSTEFAERLFDGAGQSSLSKNDSIKVDYFGVSETMEYKGKTYNGKVFNAPSDIEINKYINPQNTKDLFNYISINPKIAQGTSISVTNNVSYEITFPQRVGAQWNVWTLGFDSVVYDLSLLIRYYLDLKKKIKLLTDTDLWGNGNTKDKAEKECDTMIWVLLNLKRMGDHGQAERAKADKGIFESGDQLAAAYGMMIDVPTIVTYSRQGFGNHFILYGADLDLGQLKDMITKYLKKIPDSYIDLKVNIKDKTTTVDEVDAKKILTIVSGIEKLSDVFKVPDVKGKAKEVQFVTVLQTIVGGFEKMETDLLGGASGRESTRVFLKALPWKTLLSLFTGGKKKLKSDIEIMVNTFMLLINILGEMYSIAKELGLNENIKTYINQRLQPVIPLNDKTILETIRTNINYIIEKLREEQADTSSFGALNKYVNRFFGDIRAHVELEFADILIPINDFITKIELITTEINENNIEDTLKKFNAFTEPIPTTQRSGSRA